jgi:hypothetical protein
MSQATSRRWRLTVLLVAAAGLATAPAAHAQAVSTATPNTAGGRPATVSWSVDGTVAPVSSRIPASLVLAAPGFGLDTRVVFQRCKLLKAKLDECPKASKLGKGLMEIMVHRPNGTLNKLPIDIRLYQGPKTKIYAIAFLAGNRVVPGTLVENADGIVLTFDPLPDPPPIPGVSYDFLDVSVDLGVTRSITRKVGPKGHKRKKKFTYSLVTTPTDCSAGTWDAATALTFHDDTSALLPAPITCQDGG